MTSYLSLRDFFLFIHLTCTPFSACQSVGAAGLAAGTQAGIFGAATSIGGLAAGLFGKKKKNDDKTDDTSSNNDTPPPPDASNEKMDQEIQKENDSSRNSQSKFNYNSAEIISIFLSKFTVRN